MAYINCYDFSVLPHINQKLSQALYYAQYSFSYLEPLTNKSFFIHQGLISTNGVYKSAYYVRGKIPYCTNIALGIVSGYYLLNVG